MSNVEPKKRRPRPSLGANLAKEWVGPDLLLSPSVEQEMGQEINDLKERVAALEKLVMVNASGSYLQ